MARESGMTFRTLMLAACASMILGGTAFAQPAKTFHFDIPAEDLSVALNQVAQQSGREIVFNADLARGRRAASLQGDFTPEEALERLIAGTGLSVRTTAGGALAVEGARPQADGAQDEPVSTAISEVVVTAQKRPEKLKDVAGSLTALTAADMGRVGAEDLDQFAAYVPGLSTIETAPGITQLTLRGITTGAAQQTATVATYVDDVPYGSSASQTLGSEAVPDIDTFDIQRIEVLRGPQGTLYGASSMGGLLKYVTTPPDPDQWLGKIQVEGGGTEDGGLNYGVKAMINAPIVDDKVALRASAYYRSFSGFIDDIGQGVSDANSYKVGGGRVSLLLKPAPNLTLRLTSIVENQENGEGPSERVDGTTLQPTYGDLKDFHFVRETSSQLVQVHSFSIDWDFGWANLTSSTGYTDRKLSLISDTTTIYGPTVLAFANFLGIPLTQLPVVAVPSTTETKKITQEVRLASAPNQKLEWLVGVFYTHEDNSTQTALIAHSTQVVLPGLLANLLSLYGTAPYEEYAIFGSVDYHVTSQFDIDVGGRWSRNDQQFAESSVGLLNNPANPTTPTLLGQNSSDSSTTFRIAPRWRLNDSTTLYATASSGYRPGGPNPIVLAGIHSGSVPPTFKPDSLLNYEVGVKSALLDNRLELDLTAFDIEWSNIQLQAIAANGQAYEGNGGKARSQGVELTTSYTPTRGLALGWTGAYTDATLQDAAPGLGALKGDSLATVPKWLTTITADYSFHAWGAWEGGVGGSWRYVDDRNTGYSDSFLLGTPNYRVPAYQIVDLRASLTRRNWTIDLFANNVLDKRAMLYISPVPGTTTAEATVATPRTIGLRLTTSL